MDNSDALLRAFMEAGDEAERDAALGALLDGQVVGQVKRFFQKRINAVEDVSSFRFARLDAEDLSNQTLAEITAALVRRREFPATTPIGNLGAYTTAICKAVFAEFWRERFLEYNKLKNRIRYLLKSRPATFASAQNSDKKIICSLVGTSDGHSALPSEKIVGQIRESHPNFSLLDETALLTATLSAADGWLYLNEAVEIVANLRGIKNLEPLEVVEPGGPESNDVFVESSSVRDKYLFELDFLWREIGSLSRYQRLALLYNLRDESGHELNCVWFESGIATLGELAVRFEVETHEMPSLLSELPYSDQRIAEVLNIEGRSVANLRKVARDYLKRRRDGKQKRRSRRDGTG